MMVIMTVCLWTTYSRVNSVCGCVNVWVRAVLCKKRAECGGDGGGRRSGKKRGHSIVLDLTDLDNLQSSLTSLHWRLCLLKYHGKEVSAEFGWRV